MCDETDNATASAHFARTSIGHNLDLSCLDEASNQYDWIVDTDTSNHTIPYFSLFHATLELTQPI